MPTEQELFIEKYRRKSNEEITQDKFVQRYKRKKRTGATGYFGPTAMDKIIDYATAGHIKHPAAQPRIKYDPETGQPISEPSTRMGFFEEPTGAALAATIAGGYGAFRIGKGAIDISKMAVKKGLEWLTGGVSNIPGVGLKAGVKAASAKRLEKSMAKAAVEKFGREITAEAAVEHAAKISKAAPAIARIGTAIKEASSLRKEQATLYSLERGKRIGKAMAVKGAKGERQFILQKGKLKGELPKVEYESIRSKVTQQDIDTLFDLVEESPIVKGWDNVTAKEGLARLVGAEGGALPTDSQLAMLRKVFPPDFIKTLQKKRTAWQKVKKGTAEALNIPRALMASFDLSAPLRQALPLLSHPKRFYQSFKRMFKLFGSEKSFAALQESIQAKPTYNLMRESRLALTELGSEIGLREEIFMSSWAEKIPGVGRGVRASSRAYVGFLNKLRADVFDDLIRKADKLGLNASQNIDLSTKIARFVNAASGRSSLGAFENSAVMLNATLFSPRLMASRLTLLNPGYYVMASPFVRKEALKSLFVLTGMTTTALGLAKMGGADVGLDARSADFLKIKIGNTRVDILGGFQQYMRAAGQVMSGEYISSTTGKLVTLGEGYRPLTQQEIILRFGASKLAPVASFVWTMLGEDEIGGEKITVSKEVAKRFIPMVMQDIYDIAKEDPELLPLGIPAIFGVGLQTYGPRKRATRGGFGPIKGIGGIKGFE